MEKKSFLLTILIFIFTIFCLAPGKVFAQSYQSFSSEMQQILERARFRIGPFRLYPRIQLRDIGYDDNVYYRGDDDDPISDFTATLSPELRTYLLFRNYFIVSFTFNPEYVHYFKQARERRWNRNLIPEFKLLLFNRFVLGGRYSYSNRRYRETSEFDQRANVISEEYRGSLFYETARKTSFGITLSKANFSYEDIKIPVAEINLARALDREQQKAEFEVYYRILSDSFLFVKLGYTEYNFDRTLSYWRDSYSYQGNAGIRFPLFGRIRGLLSLGYKRLLLRQGDAQGFSGLVGNTQLEYRLGRFGFRVRYDRDSQFSFWINNIYFTDSRYGGGVSFYLTRFIRLDYGYDYGTANYPELMPIRLPSDEVQMIKRKDAYTTQSAGVVFRLVRALGLGVRVSWWSRDSNYVYEVRNRMFVGGYLTYDF